MSVFLGPSVRISFAHDDCYVIEVEHVGKLILRWRNPDARAYNQQQLNDVLDGLRRIATSAGLDWAVAK